MVLEKSGEVVLMRGVLLVTSMVVAEEPTASLGATSLRVPTVTTTAVERKVSKPGAETVTV